MYGKPTHRLSEVWQYGSGVRVKGKQDFFFLLEYSCFKTIDLIDREPDELWTEVCDIVQETEIKTIPMEKKCKKAKWLSEEALKIAVK